ncbi:MAG: homogentisate 1,2-dioxygenase [Pseudomonadota bacterium]
MATLQYLSGFANHFESEALSGVLPQGQNSPQNVAHGLYAEKLSGSAFTAPRARNRRSWLYRIRPSVVQGRFSPYTHTGVVTAPDAQAVITPDPLRWSPFAADGERDFVDSWRTIATNGNAHMQVGMATHAYHATCSMDRRYFYNADGELLIVPQSGELHIQTEFGDLDISPGEIAVIPRGVKFRVQLPNGPANGYLLENYGAMLELPERGLIGTDGLANDRDFLTPVARFDDDNDDAILIVKFSGEWFSARLDHSPLDVVAWHGNLAPYKYDLRRFNTIGSISYDHPDPSIFTVLTSPSDTTGTANIDFVIFPPRWLVMEHSFRPPWYHRNVMSEFMGLIYGEYDAKEGDGFAPGGASLHNCMSGHGPDTVAYQKAISADLAPEKLDNTMAFMFESRYLMRPTRFAMNAPELQLDYADCWQDLPRAKLP